MTRAEENIDMTRPNLKHRRANRRSALEHQLEAMRRRRKREGMTLVEIMIVVIIMAMIAAAVGVAVIPRMREAQMHQARIDASTIRGAALNYLLTNTRGDCPSFQDLVNDGQIDRQASGQDPFGNDFVIECEGDDVTVLSPGRDGQMGTEDDIRPQ